MKDMNDLSEKSWESFGSFCYFCISKCDLLSNWGRGWALAIILRTSGGKCGCCRCCCLMFGNPELLVDVEFLVKLGCNGLFAF